MSAPLAILAVHVDDLARREWRATLRRPWSFSAGLASLGLRGGPRPGSEFVDLVLEAFDRPRATAIPNVYAASDAGGLELLAWQTPKGTVIGLAGEIALAVAHGAGVEVFEQVGKPLPV